MSVRHQRGFYDLILYYTLFFLVEKRNFFIPFFITNTFYKNTFTGIILRISRLLLAMYAFLKQQEKNAKGAIRFNNIFLVVSLFNSIPSCRS